MNARTNPPATEEVTEVERPEVAKTAKKRNGRTRRIALMVSLPLALIFGGGAYWLAGGRYVETENAYVTQTKALVSADVGGRIVEVDAHENEDVRKGDVLFRIDPDPYRITLASAEAALADARLNVQQLKVAYDTARAKLAAAKDTLEIRKRWFERNGDLANRGFSSEANVDQLKLAYQQAQEDVTLASPSVESARAALDGNPDIPVDEHPSVKMAITKVESARLDLDRTTVRAPADGIVSQTGKLNVGQYATAGAAMLTLVETGNVWVEANLKETQLAGVRPGQKVDVTVDAYPDLKLSGKVVSIGAGTGSEFSLIPAQNATGNWVKVVQRLPVRLALSGDTAKLRTGMSAEVAIDTGKSRWQEYMK
jgi:membrane fusion protein (multidrug efflux system)